MSLIRLLTKSQEFPQLSQDSHMLKIRSKVPLAPKIKFLKIKKMGPIKTNRNNNKNMKKREINELLDCCYSTIYDNSCNDMCAKL